MSKFICTDGNADIEVEAVDCQEAAELFVDGGDWDTSGGTLWVTVYVFERAEDGGRGDRVDTVTVNAEPIEPECDDGAIGHDWREISLRGNDGGVIVEERCDCCGLRKRTNTWDTNPSNGEQGLTSVCYLYLDADEA